MDRKWIEGQRVALKMPEAWAHGSLGVYLGEAIEFEDQRGMAGLKMVTRHLVRVKDANRGEITIICGKHQMEEINELP